MNNYIFQSTDNWKNALMNLPDNNFFELLRSFFGNIKTPFNKQGLLNDLCSMLSRDTTQDKIKSYIDKTDHKLIAAMALLNNPAVEEMESFFKGEFSGHDLQGLIINLEERLIVYRFRDNKITRLALNPVLEPVLSPCIENVSILFPSRQNVKKESTPPLQIKEERQLASLLSFFLYQEDIYKTGEQRGGFRKKIQDDASKLFPGLDAELSLKILLKLDLLTLENNKVLFNKDSTESFGKLAFNDALLYWTTALYLCLEEDNKANEENYIRTSRKRCKQIAAFLKKLKNYLDPGILYPETTIRRIAKLAEMEENKLPWASHLFEDKALINYDFLLEAFSKTGFLQQKEAENKTETQHAEPLIVMDTAFSLILYPEISFADALKLAEFCNVNDTPLSLPAVSFLLTRESAVRAFDQGISSEEMQALLEKLSLNRIDSNLGWTLKEWEKRYAEVSLSSGLILILSGERQYLAEAEPLASLIQKCLAPGVYLLSANETEALGAIRKTGVDIIAQPRYKGEEKTKSSWRTSYDFTPLESPQGRTESKSLLANNKNKNEVDSSNEGKLLKEKYHKLLNTMELSKTEKDELSSRIERRLVLNETQLDKSSVRYEKLEARGLDFAGKTSIAKQAVDSKSILEISWPGSGGDTNSCTGIAEALEKKGNESILVIKAEENIFRVPLNKISLIKRIKQSIFIRS